MIVDALFENDLLRMVMHEIIRFLPYPISENSTINTLRHNLRSHKSSILNIYNFNTNISEKQSIKIHIKFIIQSYFSHHINQSASTTLNTIPH